MPVPEPVSVKLAAVPVAVKVPITYWPSPPVPLIVLESRVTEPRLPVLNVFSKVNVFPGDRLAAESFVHH